MPVIVLGMHRSGTSALTRCVNLMGLPIGREEDLVPAASDNPRGFWEHRTLTGMNDEVLQSFHGKWFVPPYLPDGWWSDPRLKELAHQARTLLSDLDQGPHWCWKDPRICLTLPFWTELFSHSPLILFIRRNPLEIYRSLEKRNAIDKQAALALWSVYTYSALVNLRSLPVLVLDFGELLHNPQLCLNRIKRFCEDQGIAGLDVPSPAVLDAFLTGDLRHWQYTDEEFFADAEIGPALKQLYRLVLELPAETLSFETPELSRESFLIEPLVAIGQDGLVAFMRQLEQEQANLLRGAEEREKRLEVVDQERRAWRELAEERDAYIADLEQAKLWAEQKRDAALTANGRLESRIQEQHTYITTIEATLGWRIGRRMRERVLPASSQRGRLVRRVLRGLRGALS